MRFSPAPSRRTAVSITALLLVSVVRLLAQATSGSITGTVMDSSGASVPGATVTVTSEAVGVHRTVTSNEAGTFVVPDLVPGDYAVTVTAQGFKQLEKTGIRLSATDRLNIGALTLEIGSATETVSVTAESADLQLQASSGERSDLITGNQLNNLALNGRNILDFVRVVPGVVSDFNGQVAGTGGIDAFNVNGTRANQHEFTIDGSSNVDTGNNGGTHVTLNPDAVAEVKLLTSNYQAEFGKAGGGMLVVTTRSGTKDLHGDLRFFHRHEGLNANNWFNNQAGTPRPLYRYNYFGYQVGGPVLLPRINFNRNRDKLFFFWSQEFYRQLIPGGIDQFRVPTQLERTGDFSQTTDGNGHPLVIYNPATGAPFPNNRIDRNMLTPPQQATFDQVSKILSLYSLPNVPGNGAYNYATQLSYDSPRREDLIRVDYQVTPGERFYGRFIHNSTRFESPMQTWNLNCMGQLQYPGGCIASNPSWNLAVNLTSTLSPTLINEVIFGPSVTRSDWRGNNGNISRGANAISLPMLFPVTPDVNVPDLGFSGNENISYPWSYLGANPWFQANTTINLTDNLTKVTGAHTLKAGVFFQRARKDQIAWGNYNGQISFSNCATSSTPTTCSDNTTGNAYASALLGSFTSLTQSSSRPIGYFRYTNLEFYAQDTWKLSPRLTLDYGMRFSWFQPQYDARNQLAIFDPGSYNPSKAVRLYVPAVGGGAYDPAHPNTIVDAGLAGTVVPNSGDLLNGMRFASDGFYRGGWEDRGLMLEPRFGFAYALSPDLSTVIRGGFGLMHDRTQGNLVFNPVFTNPRLVVTPVLNNGNLSNLSAVSPSNTPPLGSVIGASPDGHVPTIYSYSLGVQRKLGAAMTIDVAYVGSLSRHLVSARNINQIPYLTAFSRAAQDPSKYPSGVVPNVEPDLPAAYSQAGFNYSGNYAFDAPFLVPYRGYGPIEYYQFDGTANYNSLQISLQRRFAKALTFGVAYTFSKTLTTANADEDMVDRFNTRQYDYRLASWDRPHVLAFNYVWDLPAVNKHVHGPKWLGFITDNYQLSGITTIESGAPIDPGLWWSPAMTINGTYNAWWINYSRAYVYPLIGPNVNNAVGTSKFDPSAFIAPPVGIPPAGSRSVLRGGGMQDWDVSLFKNFPFRGEGRYLQLRFEAFNIFNHPNFSNVYLNWQVNPPTGTTPTTLTLFTRPPGDTALYGNYFGEYNSTYTGTGGPRVIQLAVKLYF